MVYAMVEQTQVKSLETNPYLSGSLVKIFVKTAMPIIFIMLVNGLFTIVDAYFLGEFVGADALTAVTLMFPAFMVIIALSGLVSTGYSSVIARLIGAKNQQAANKALAEASFLAILLCLTLMLLFVLGGEALINIVSTGQAHISTMGNTYISILIYLSPIMFLMGINTDSLRAEGMMGAMIAATMTSLLLNFIFNYTLIVIFEMGVAGSAYGTILAQIFGLALAYYLRKKHSKIFTGKLIEARLSVTHWAEFIALGVPTSLTYLGFSMLTAAMFYKMQTVGLDNYNATVGAYGIISRIQTFQFLPLLGLSLAFQSVAGNNYGAKQYGRVNASLKLTLVIAVVYGASIQLLLNLGKHKFGGVFVDDLIIQKEVAKILPPMMMTLVIFAPLLIISTYFQTIGDAKKAAFLSLPRAYLFSLPLILLLPSFWGEWGIWYSGALAEICMLTVAIVVLYIRKKQHGYKWGLFFKNETEVENGI